MIYQLFNFIAPYITWVIIAGGIGNIIVLIVARSKITKLCSLVHSWTFYDFHGKGSDDAGELIKASDSAAFWYTLYANITAIFPLMGIFGTVCSLLNSTPGNDATNNFFIALDTTVWGLVFAIGFKFADSFISSKLDRALDEADYRIHKLNQETRKDNAQTETGYRN